MDYCRIDGIKTIIKFIFLLFKLIDSKQITKEKCRALNNPIINQQILRVFKTREQELSEEYKRLVYECSGFYYNTKNMDVDFEKLYKYFLDIPENIKHKKIFENLEVNKINF
jgi:hypothetical protein